MKTTIVFATNNGNKAKELGRLLGGVDVKTLKEMGVTLDVEEDRKTLKENAEKKAAEYLAELKRLHTDTDFVVIAEDFGFFVEALPGELGVRSKRFSEEETDEANNELLLVKMHDVENRKCHYESVMAVNISGIKYTVTGRTDGTVAKRIIEGIGGFAYDKLMLVGGKTISEMTAEEKDKISSRGEAVRLIKELVNFDQY